MKRISSPDAAQIHHRERSDAGSFVIERDGARIAEIGYVIERAPQRPPRAIVNHTFVAKALRGQGIGQELVRTLAQWAARNAIELVAVCPFARAVLAENPQLGRQGAIAQAGGARL
ncbi:MAG TPA: GNAT family N-acetyltransferase [Burkholderiaceae bacterium]|nr:GNAT family N-acetyltransferase [Burkholderiaceae bacterium]